MILHLCNKSDFVVNNFWLYFIITKKTTVYIYISYLKEIIHFNQYSDCNNATFDK